MSTTVTELTRCYRFQGAILQVTSDDPQVAAALDRRLQACAASSTSAPDVDLRLEYLTGPTASLPDLPGEARPVYDTPAGSVSYWPAADALSADFGAVSMWGYPGAGAVHVRAEQFASDACYLATHPLTMIALSELLKRRARYMLHAACVSVGTETAVIAGASGTGKSTLSLALAQLGLGFLSDDMVFLERCDQGVVTHGFSDAIGVTRETAARFEELSDLAATDPPTGYRKHLIRIEERFAVTTVPQGRPRWLLFPELVGGVASRLEPLDGQEAWLRLVPDVLLTDPAATRAHLAAIAALCEQVSCYRICCGTDARSAARLVAELVS